MRANIMGKLVSEHASKIVAVVLILTLVFGYFATQVEMETDYTIFMPDDELSRAYVEISEDYYAMEMVQILAKYDNGNAVSKESLIEGLELEKQFLQDPDIVENLQTPDEPSRSIYTVADMVISLDMAGNGMVNMMNSTISMVPVLQQMNSSLDGVQGSLSGYLFQYSQDPTSNETMQALYTSYMVLDMFLNAGEGIEMPEMPGGPPSLTVDQKIAYLNNMSDEELHNILVYGTPLSPDEMMDLGMRFMQASQEVSVLASDISQKSNSTAVLIGASLQTEPVRANSTINTTFSMSYGMFSQMEVQFAMLSETMENIGDYMDMSLLNMMTTMMHAMISTDFNEESASASATLMTVQLNGTYTDQGETNDDMLAIHMKIKEIADGFQGNGQYSVMSMRLMNEDMGSSMDQTFQVLLPIAFLLVIIILVAVFRSAVDTILGLLGLFMAIIWAYGIGVIMDLSFNVITTTVAILIVGLGIDYAIHTIMRYREEIRNGRDVKEATRNMEAHLGMALILATVTTMISFLSNLSSPIPPLQDYGIMNAVGIFSAFILFITFIPAVKVLLDGRKEKAGKEVVKKGGSGSGSGVKVINRALSFGATGAEHHPWKVIGVVLIISLASLYGAANIGTEFSSTDFLPQDTESYQILDYIASNFNASGMEESYILVKGDIASPELLKAMDATQQNMKDDEYISIIDSQSIVYLIRSRAASDENFSAMVMSLDTDGDGLPDSSVGQVYDYLMAHEDRAKYVLHRENGEYTSTLMRIKPTSETNSQHEILYNELLSDIKPLKDAGFYAQPTGGPILLYHITTTLEDSQWNSLIVTLIVTLLVLVIAFWYLRRSVMLGVITTLPVLIALLWSMGIMYLIGMDFDMMTITITSLTIGLGITYAIHLTHRFVEELETREPEEAIRETVLNTGSAIFGAAATTMGGFGVLMLSSMPPMQDFGIITTMSIGLSFLLAVFVLPTFLVMWARKKGYGRSE